MSSPLSLKRPLLLLAILAVSLSSCGGKASSETQSPAAAGASAGASSAGAAGVAGVAGADASNPKMPEPSIVRVIGNDLEVDPQARPGCIEHFQGFYAQLGGMSLDFKAFVSEPGDYDGDPIRILWLDAQRTNGEHYRATAGTVGLGFISLHVEQVEPRFIGSLEAQLFPVDDPTLAPLTLRLSFDIAARAACP